MSERPINDQPSTPAAPASVDAAAAQLASARRRRFIKAGAGAVPVALTLASRPVMATNCVTASAWGSTMGLAGTSQYLRARTPAKAVEISGAKPLSEWKQSSTSTSAGNPSCTSWTNSALCGSGASATTIKNYKVSSLCGSNAIAGITSPTTTTVWSILWSTGTTDSDKYKRAMVVAWLNAKISPTVAQCVTDPTRPTVNNLKTFGLIGTGGGTGPDGKIWSQAAVVTYLFDNYISK